ncbi:isochorismatase family protein [Candidatus Woesearchaeota archaeon]|nr:isochorismatase family protein [Candidatus Woesearchaeota archaeon]
MKKLIVLILMFLLSLAIVNAAVQTPEITTPLNVIPFTVFSAQLVESGLVTPIITEVESPKLGYGPVGAVVDDFYVNNIAFSITDLLSSGFVSMEVYENEIILKTSDSKSLTLISHTQKPIKISNFQGFGDFTLGEKTFGLKSGVTNILVDVFDENKFVTLVVDKDKNIYAMPLELSKSIYLGEALKQGEYYFINIFVDEKYSFKTKSEDILADPTNSSSLLNYYFAFKSSFENENAGEYMSTVPFLKSDGTVFGFANGNKKINNELVISSDGGNKPDYVFNPIDKSVYLIEDNYPTSIFAVKFPDGVDSKASLIDVSDNNYYLAQLETNVQKEEGYTFSPRLTLQFSNFPGVEMLSASFVREKDGKLYNDPYSSWKGEFCENQVELKNKAVSSIGVTYLANECEGSIFSLTPSNTIENGDLTSSLRDKKTETIAFGSSAFRLLRYDLLSFQKGVVKHEPMGFTKPLLVWGAPDKILTYYDGAGNLACLVVPPMRSSVMKLTGKGGQLDTSSKVPVVLAFSQDAVKVCSSKKIVDDLISVGYSVDIKDSRSLPYVSYSLTSETLNPNNIPAIDTSVKQASTKLNELMLKQQLPIVLVKENFEITPLSGPIYIETTLNGFDGVINTITDPKVVKELNKEKTTGETGNILNDFKQKNPDVVNYFNQKEEPIVNQNSNNKKEDLSDKEVVKEKTEEFKKPKNEEASTKEKYTQASNVITSSLPGNSVNLNDGLNKLLNDPALFSDINKMADLLGLLESTNNEQKIKTATIDENTNVITNGKNVVVSKKVKSKQEMINDQHKEILTNVANKRGVDYEVVRKEWKEGKINAFDLKGDDVYDNYKNDVKQLNDIVNENYEEVEAEVDNYVQRTEREKVIPIQARGNALVVAYVSENEAKKHGANFAFELENMINLIKKANDLNIPVFIIEQESQNVTIKNDGKNKVVQWQEFDVLKEINALMVPETWTFVSSKNDVGSIFDNSNLGELLKENNIDTITLAGWDQQFALRETIIDAKEKGYRIFTSFDIIQGSIIGEQEKVRDRKEKQRWEDSQLTPFEKGTSEYVSVNKGKTLFKTIDSDARNGNTGEIVERYSPESLLKFYEQNTNLVDSYKQIPFYSLEPTYEDVVIREEKIKPKTSSTTTAADKPTPKVDEKEVLKQKQDLIRQEQEKNLKKIKIQRDLMTERIEAVCYGYELKGIGKNQIAVQAYPDFSSDPKIERECDNWKSINGGRRSVSDVPSNLQYAGYDADLAEWNSLLAERDNLMKQARDPSKVLAYTDGDYEIIECTCSPTGKCSYPSNLLGVTCETCCASGDQFGDYKIIECTCASGSKCSYPSNLLGGSCEKCCKA